MTAKPAACNAIRYEDGSMTTIVLDDNGGDTETVNYTGGTGVFRLNSTNEAAVFADVGVCFLAILNAMRAMKAADKEK